jgi:hypothetical protein
MDSVVDAVFVLPAASVNAPPATDNAAVPPFTPEVGVKTNEYELPDPVNPLTAPPVAETSLEMNVEEASDS